MMKVKARIAIIDDCKDDIKKVNHFLTLAKLLPEVGHVVFAIDAYLDPIEFLRTKKKYDFVLLDVDMPQISGFGVAAELNLKQPKCLIIFLTSYGERAKQGFKVRAHRYTTKPIDEEEFNEAIISAINEIRSLGSIPVIDGFKTKSLELANVLYFESFGKESIVYTTADKNFDCKLSLKELEARLPDWLFFRAYKQYLINMEYYDSVDRKRRLISLECDGIGVELEISEAKLKKLADSLHLYRKMKGRR